MNVPEREALMRELLAPHLPGDGDASAILVGSLGRPESVDALTYEMICSTMIWEHEVEAGVIAAGKLLGGVIDLNELRVTPAPVMSSVIGGDYPLSLDRCERLRETLNSVYQREDSVTIAALAGRPKRAAEEFLASTPGMSPFVQARVLLAIGIAAAPVDGRSLAPMIRAGVFAPDTAPHAARSWIERRLSAGETPRYAVALERYAMEQSRSAGPRAKAPRRRAHSPAKKSGD